MPFLIAEIEGSDWIFTKTAVTQWVVVHESNTGKDASFWFELNAQLQPQAHTELVYKSVKHWECWTNVVEK